MYTDVIICTLRKIDFANEIEFLANYRINYDECVYLFVELLTLST